MSCNRLVDAMEDGEVTTMVCDLEVGRGNLSDNPDAPDPTQVGREM